MNCSFTEPLLYLDQLLHILQQVMAPVDPTMSTANPKSFTVPKLACNGSNWVTWKSQTMATLSSTRGMKRHLDGMARVPPAIPTYPKGHTLTEEEEDELDDLERCWDDYNQCEATIMAQIFTTVPDSVLIEVWNLATAKEVWKLSV